MIAPPPAQTGTHQNASRVLSNRAGLSLAIALTMIAAAVSISEALSRYQEFRSGFSWDLAYYNQWFWAITNGDGVLTVRPGAAYAFEGPSVWKMNYLSPIRLLLLPVYALFPDPRTLLVVQNIIFWCAIPAAYTLVRAESKSNALALSAAVLVPLTPIAWPLVLNDFRELQLAIPFVLWAVQGWRQRRPQLAALAIAGMLACRQEYALVVMSLALLPPQQPESSAPHRKWTFMALAAGGSWLLVFLVYLAWRVDPHAPADYLTLFTTAGSTVPETSARALHFLLVGLASWAVLAVMAPRVAVLAVPWAWILMSGHWDVRLLSTRHWHHVRYTTPMTALVLAAGLVGYARTHVIFLRSSRGAALALWLLAAASLATQTLVVRDRMAAVPRHMSEVEAKRLWSFIARVQPQAGVFASYEVTAPLSSRRWLYGYELPENRPPGYPRLIPEIRWAFVKKGDLPSQMFTEQGFVELDAGPAVQVFMRPAP